MYHNVVNACKDWHPRFGFKTQDVNLYKFKPTMVKSKWGKENSNRDGIYT